MRYVECYKDETLAKRLGIPKQQIRHSPGKTKLCYGLENTTNSKGMIDEEPWSRGNEEIPYIKKLKTSNPQGWNNLQHSIRVLDDKDKQNKLIVLCPNLEGWILEAAKEVKIDVTKSPYGLPDDKDELHKVLGTKTRNENYEKLLDAMLKAKSPMLKTLEQLLKK
ncbi:MAG: hypothetical protein AB1599_00130 [Planctomycetota bacterium]